MMDYKFWWTTKSLHVLLTTLGSNPDSIKGLIPWLAYELTIAMNMKQWFKKVVLHLLGKENV